MDTGRVLRQLYARKPRRSLAAANTWRDRIKAWIRRRSYAFGGASLIVAGWIASHVHYYNRMVTLECEIHESRAQIRTQEQRRYHVRRALLAVARQYAKYEQSLLTAVTELRTGPPPAPSDSKPVDPAASSAPPSAPASASAMAPPPAPPGATKPSVPSGGTEIMDLLKQLKIVAEQYPDLKLSEPLKQLSSAVIESETEIAMRIMKYNDAVNAYTTLLDTFPSNVFARLSGFKAYAFYEVDPRKLSYQELEF